MLRHIPLLALLCCSLLGSKAQTMEFVGGSLTVTAGTTLELIGPISWNLAGDAQVVNDGHIELGEQGHLEETIGAPITGTGTETATWPIAGPMSGADRVASGSRSRALMQRVECAWNVGTCQPRTQFHCEHRALVPHHDPDDQ
ncbi:MAG: hypothetical protein IPG92_12915 [Flavobacteriales bacterium]|nr:hypothetical protein [Flavobacteriales bacterium]